MQGTLEWMHRLAPTGGGCRPTWLEKIRTPTSPCCELTRPASLPPDRATPGPYGWAG